MSGGGVILTGRSESFWRFLGTQPMSHLKRQIQTVVAPLLTCALKNESLGKDL